MNALVKKEIRLLLPSFLIGVALTFANGLWNEDPFANFGYGGYGGFAFFVSLVFCPAIAVFMALNSFGAEISAGTFSMLLAQPVSRRRIWWTKTSLLAAALLIGGFLWCVILRLHIDPLGNKNPGAVRDLRGLLSGAWLFLLVVYSGALWTVLLLRQVAAAFWFTLLVPSMIMVVVIGTLGEKHNDLVRPGLVAAMLIYSVTGFLFARRLFLRAQDVAWTGGTISFSEMRGAASFLGGAAEKRCWRPQAALFWKELQLHQSQFIMAGALALLHLGIIATRKFGNYPKNSSMEFILEIFWGLWLVMPMLVGAAAVAEERKLGTLGSQFGLPVKRRTQFAVKFRVSLLLSVLFGAVVPLLLEGQRILPNLHVLPSSFHFNENYLLLLNTWQSFIWHCLDVINVLTPLLTLLAMATAIGAISFYASTLTRNTLQALAPAVLGIIVFAFLLFNAHWPELLFDYPLWHGPLIYFIGVPLFVLALVAMSFWNFQRVNLVWNVWLWNTFVFVSTLAFVIAATTAVYHRAWEKLTPFEPSHGTAQLSLSNPATLNQEWNGLSVRLPGGIIWTGADQFFLISPNPLARVLGQIRLASLDQGHFYDGSNWMNVIGGSWRGEQAGIKADGTLWISEKPARRERLAGGGWKMTKAGDLVRFGSETNWSSMDWHGPSMLLVKNDGTLWRWGTTNWNFTRDEWPGLRSFTPYRLGTESNWTEVFLDDYRRCLRKTDGSVWTTDFTGRKNQQTNELEPGFTVERAPIFEKGKWRGTTTARSGVAYHLGVRDDGTFRIWADQRLNQKSLAIEDTSVDFQFGNDTNWLGVAGRGQKIVTLKSDGTLWLWNFYHNDSHGWDAERDERAMLRVKPVRLGTHADWIAVAGANGGIVSLAADGSLWYWPLESANYMDALNSTLFYGNSGSHFEPLLEISRKPQLIGNVFGKTD